MKRQMPNHKSKTGDPADEETSALLRERHAMAAEIASELEDEMGPLSLELAVKALPAVPTVREVKSLLLAAQSELRDYLAMRIPYYTGVRVGELAAFCLADFFDDGTALVRQGKGGYDRYVCVDPKTLALVRKLHGSKDPAKPVLGVGERQIERIVRDYGLQTGLVQKYEAMARSFSPHSLRHAFATHRYNNGMDLFTLQKLLGHRYLTTTLIYVQTSMHHIAAQYRKTDPLREK